jgi:histidinol dehydrogenase
MLLKLLSDPIEAPPLLAAITNRTNGPKLLELRHSVDTIIESVRIDGDRALVDLTERLDGAKLKNLQVPAKALEEAWQSTPKPLQQAIQLAKDRISAFHQEQLPKDITIQGPHGEKLCRRWRAVDRAGLYVPGGRASYPSTVLMNAIPAGVAGVKQRVMVTPPGPNGSVNKTVLAAAHLTGIDQVYSVGGAQAIAALAWGTETIPKVDVISGPGNIYVTLAKKALFGQVGIDSLAGPSEVLIIADDSADSILVAADLLAQAEHDPLAAAILLTTSQRLASEVLIEVEKQLNVHPRRELTSASIRDWGLVVLCENLEQAAELSDSFAPEHLELQVDNPDQLAERIQHAGAIFLGSHTPEAVGDYLAGPNHTLPTSGTCRFSGALSVETFMRHTSIIAFNQRALGATGEAIMTLAASEGLHSHAESVKLRLRDRS